MKLKFFDKFFGDKSFYKNVLTLSVPIFIQNGITASVSMLDNIMIGSLGTEAMSGVSIANQLFFIFNMIIFGALAAVGIFTSQFHGAKDEEGVRYTFRIKTYINLLLTAVTVIVLALFGSEAIRAFLHPDGSGSDLELTFNHGMDYMVISLIGLFPYAMSQVYASTLRESEETKLPMWSGFVAISVNFILNILLIFGNLGFPELGVKGAAIATVISRFAELFFLVIAVHMRREKYAFIIGVFASFAVPVSLFKQVIIKGCPLLLNEILWSTAMWVKNLCLSSSGIESVAALSIQTTVFNVLNISYIAVCASIAVILGNMLGGGKIDEARKDGTRLITFAFLVGVIFMIVDIALSPLFPLLYNTGDQAKELATYMLIISGLAMPLYSAVMACYYTLRSGGLTLITLLYDCVWAWGVTTVSALVFTYLIPIGIRELFAVVTFAEAAKIIPGIILVSKIKWANKIT